MYTVIKVSVIVFSAVGMKISLHDHIFQRPQEVLRDSRRAAEHEGAHLREAQADRRQLRRIEQVSGAKGMIYRKSGVRQTNVRVLLVFFPGESIPQANLPRFLQRRLGKSGKKLDKQKVVASRYLCC